MSLASSNRKNDTSCDTDHKTSFNDSRDRLEFGAIEAERKWEDRNGRKYITDSLKLKQNVKRYASRTYSKM
ncbi:12689_t:CDS:2 [Rhizophagus irregularis]|nr:12689_t:CDS:2 [Rhizophagus irregularis]